MWFKVTHTRYYPRSRVRTMQNGMLALFISLFLSSASAAQFSADEVKAVYLFNFTSFITWPEDAFKKPSDPFTYCSFGNKGAVTKPLGEILLGEKVDERAVKFKTITKISDIKGCQVLYIDQLQHTNTEEILRKTKVMPILTVSDMNGFAKQGGAVEFSTKGGRIKLLINVSKIKDARLNVSSKLLRIADLINSPSEADEPW